jgi:hypothetical protein
MLDNTSLDTVADAYTVEELDIFSQARASGIGLRKTFDQWLCVGRAAEIARRHADSAGGSKRIRDARFRTIMSDNGLSWINSKNRNHEIVRLLAILERLDDVQKWRSTLSELERARWSSAQSVYNSCPIFHPDGKTKGPIIRPKPMSVRELLHMPAAEAALMIYRRDPAKMFAIMRAKKPNRFAQPQ